MPAPGSTPQRLTVTPLHLVRAGSGHDVVRVEARGFGLVLGTFGLFVVRGAVDRVWVRRFRAGRCWALFVGGHGVAFASARLAPEGKALVPVVEALSAPAPLALRPLPRLEVQLRVSAPEPP